MQDGEVPIEEDRVDGVSHEPGVNGVRRLQEQALLLAERFSPEQTAKTRERVVGDEAPLARDPSVGVLERDVHLVPHVDVVVVVAEREGRPAQAEQRDHLLGLQLAG